MSLIQKVGVGLASMTGVSTAVSVPLALRDERQQATVNFDNIPIKPVSAQILSFDNLEKCSGNSGENISFGQKGVDRVCGYIEKSAVPTEMVSEDYKYTDLFKRVGNSENSTGSSLSESGTTSCGKSKGTFNNQKEGSESLGLCDEPQSLNQGITTQNQDNSLISVEICSGECFKSQKISDGKTLNASDKQGTGKQIKFRKLG